MTSTNILLRPIKYILRPIYRKLRRSKWIRRLLTSNFSSGLVTLGEQNTYGIGGDWITVDYEDADFIMDFRQHKVFPFENESQQVIYSSHTFEHLDEQTVFHVLKECYRILEKGGYLRIEVPDLAKIVGAYVNGDHVFIGSFVEGNRENLVQKRGYSNEYLEDHNIIIGLISCYVEDNVHVPVLATKGEVDKQLELLSLKDFGRWCVSLQTPEQLNTMGHVNPHTFESLSEFLDEIGFSTIKATSNRTTEISKTNLNRIERTHRAYYSLYIEACK